MTINKRVLYISYDGMTDPLGQSQVIPYLQQLTKYGYQFTILSVEKKKQFQVSGEKTRYLLSDMGIRWETLNFSKHPPVISKLFDQWRLNIKAASLYRQQKFDLIHCRSYVAAATAIKLLYKFHVPFLFDMRGFWVDERVDSRHWNLNNPFYKILYKLYKKKEKTYFSKSAHIITLTQKGKDELIESYSVPLEKITVIPCCADLDHFDYKNVSDQEKKNAKEKLGISDDQKVISYLGSLGGWYMTDEMLDFFAVMKKRIPESKLLFITKDNKEQIIKKAFIRGISEKDILVQPATRNEVPLYLSVSDWSVFFIKDVYSKKASSPTKQGEIMGMGIPIICNDIGDTGYIIKDTNSGFITEGFSLIEYNKIVDNLERLKTINRSDIRDGAFHYFDLQNGVADYRKAYEKILQ